MSIIEHFSDFFGEKRTFSEKNGALWIKVEHFSGKTKA